MHTDAPDLALNSAAPNRDARGRLLPGHRAGGRPKGSVNVAGRAEIDRLRQRSAAVWSVIDQRLASGCVKTALWLASRLLPDSRVVEVDSSDPAEVAASVVDGSLTTTEANRLALALKSLREIEQVDAIAARLSEIERLLDAKGRG